MNSFAIRIPTREEVVKTFGSAKRAIRLTHCDLPTALHFIANPEKAEGFVSPGGRRVGFPEFGKLLRQWSKEETLQQKEEMTMFHISDGTNNALIEATRENIAVERFVSDHYAPKLTVRKVSALEAITLAGEHGLKPIVIPVRARAGAEPGPRDQPSDQPSDVGDARDPAGD